MAIFAIDFIKKKHEINDQNKAYQMLVKANWDPNNS